MTNLAHFGLEWPLRAMRSRGLQKCLFENKQRMDNSKSKLVTAEEWSKIERAIFLGA